MAWLCQRREWPSMGGEKPISRTYLSVSMASIALGNGGSGTYEAGEWEFEEEEVG